MSCVGMALANVVYHKYMKAYSQVTALSFVDNLEAIGATHIDLHGGIMVMQQWASMLQLQLDENKSYVWANSADLRAKCAMLG